ncbi:MAG: Mannose-6-phosphate isomerase [uncultured Thermomicrobiales bacterium]|uniref:Phosphohexomutase n=1 Tax=uncultured Thermomicrobiales bacterium TaxID=1645740 RepID=A0A6J4UH96_9BACT|nr:MAG: Mannose-6-phosphate isomerase [uncultured Thermomicrobiales bacterium]
MPDTSPAGPFAVQPRLDVKPWGGSRLAAYGFEAPGGSVEPLGEVVVSASQSIITTGPWQGTSLGDLTARFPGAVAGHLGRAVTGGRPVFPLLIKLIDAAQHLSIQVHPDDDLAAAADSTGKTEAWYVLDAPADGQLFLGLTSVSTATFLAACRDGDGSSARYLRTVSARAGETVILPAGTVHALGAGVLVYEVQQPSEITYRLDDWGRVGADGQPRARHLEEGGRAIKPYLRPVPTAGIDREPVAGDRRILAACRYFALERISLWAGGRIETTTSGSPQVLTVIDGEATIRGGDTELTAARGDSVVVPAALHAVTVTGPEQATVLRSWVPDLLTEIIAPAHRAGVSDSALAAIDVTIP